eukprot:scaffold204_cov135-Skeletonema_menzelii.AAC.3
MAAEGGIIVRFTYTGQEVIPREATHVFVDVSSWQNRSTQSRASARTGRRCAFTLQDVLPHDIVTNNVLTFLELPSHTFE